MGIFFNFVKSLFMSREIWVYIFTCSIVIPAAFFRKNGFFIRTVELRPTPLPSFSCCHCERSVAFSPVFLPVIPAKLAPYRNRGLESTLGLFINFGVLASPFVKELALFTLKSPLK
jgi:hypothetical protein